MSTIIFAKEEKVMRVVTGIQPTGTLHLGNYLGAIRPLVALQAKADRVFAFIADLHSLSAKVDPALLAESSRRMAAALIACGVEPDRSILFRQSRVPAHAELALLLSGIARTGQLERMIQFKEKSSGIGENSEGPRLLLFTYPVLQAADILLYQATHVPVGEDQRQHLQLVREIARKFNHDHARHDPVFIAPDAYTEQAGTRIMSLQNGSSKMSKSDPSDLSRITLDDDEDAILRKIRKAKSDADFLPDNLADLENRKEAKNLLTIHAALCDQPLEKSIASFAGQGFGRLKSDLADVAIAVFSPISERYREILEHRDHLETSLRDGENRARQRATPVLEHAYQALGMR